MVRVLYTLAYPVLRPTDRVMIDAFRDTYDLAYRDVVKPHFTLVFGCSEIDALDYIGHVRTCATAVEPISFTCRYAMLGVDHADASSYVFLVPDEGYSALSLLHDGLYTGPLAARLNLDIPYIPHITIGTLSDRAQAKALCDELNAAGLLIVGTVSALTVGALEHGVITDLDTITLQG